MELILTVAGPLIGAVGAVVAAGVAWLTVRGKNRAEAMKSSVEAMDIAMKSTLTWLHSLETKVSMMQTEIDGLRGIILHYQTQVAGMMMGLADKLQESTNDGIQLAGDNNSAGAGSAATFCGLGDQGLCVGECESCFAGRLNSSNQLSGAVLDSV
jgi:TolA-binding protein